MNLISDMNIRIKLVISFLLASMIPFLFVSVFAVILFQNDKEEEILERLNSDLDTQTNSVESYLGILLENAQSLAFVNPTTKDSLTKLFRDPPKEGDILRSIVANQSFPHFKQYMKEDIRRILVVMNARETTSDKGKEDIVVGEIVYSINGKAPRVNGNSLG
ncbi:MAG: hypothetical protein GY866_11375 [Proteobacteria bacterium]|nr:hypothetical protein [Pseudomonadota bacterium]